MNSFPIGVRLTAWYFVVLGVTLSLFGLIAYFAMRTSIHHTVDEELRARTEGVRRLILRTVRYGEEDLQRELRQHSELAGGALLQVSDEKGNWLYRSPTIGSYDISRSQESSNAPSTLVFNDVPLRLLSAKIQAGDQAYLVQVATPLDDFYSALHRFGALLLILIPILLLCATGGGYWM